MGRSLSDDPVKLENELLGVSRRAHAIRTKLTTIEREREGEPDVLTGDALHSMVDEIKSTNIVKIGEATPALLGIPVEDEEWDGAEF